MVRINWKKLIITYLILIGVQFLVRYLLGRIGISGIYVLIADSFVFAFFLNIINYPASLRKYMFKDKYFYRNTAIYFLIFLLIDLLFSGYLL